MVDSRIQAMINFVSFDRVADIGADHGYLSIELMKTSRAKKIIATEKNIGPCDALRKNISAAGLSDVIDVRLGDGLKIFSASEVDTICIAGMGGALIKKILDDAPEVVQSARQLILQPMNAVEKVRAHLQSTGWVIDDEDLAESAGIIYEIISAIKIQTTPKIFKRESSPLKQKFFSQRLEKLLHIRDEMLKSSAARSTEKFFALLAEIDDCNTAMRNS